MGAMIKDSTTLDVIALLNRRFHADELPEMVELQKEFSVFSSKHSLHHSFALLGLVPCDRLERERWYKFLELLRTYPSDIGKLNGHDRIVKAFKDNLAPGKALPIAIVCHAAAEDPRVIVSRGRPAIFSLDDYVLISIPTTPGRVARRQAADAAKARRSKKTGK